MIFAISQIIAQPVFMEPRYTRLRINQETTYSNNKYFRFVAGIWETHQLGQPQRISNHLENTSATPKTAPEHHFRSAATMVGYGRINIYFHILPIVDRGLIETTYCIERKPDTPLIRSNPSQ